MVKIAFYGCFVSLSLFRALARCTFVGDPLRSPMVRFSFTARFVHPPVEDGLRPLSRLAVHCPLWRGKTNV
jgi:hypothetical protein